MRPNWRQVTPTLHDGSPDPLYDAGTPKWVAPSYGVDDLRDVPDVGPDDHTASNAYWQISRTPNSNTIGSRFVAQRA